MNTLQTEPTIQVLSIQIQFDGDSRRNPSKISGAGAVVHIDTAYHTNNTSNDDRNNDTKATKTTKTATAAAAAATVTTYHIRQV
jgi:ribonuclease HI